MPLVALLTQKSGGHADISKQCGHSMLLLMQMLRRMRILRLVKLVKSVRPLYNFRLVGQAVALEALDALARMLSSTLGLTSLALALVLSSSQNCQALELMPVARAVELEALVALALMISSTLSLISPALVLVLCSAQDCQALVLILGRLLDGGAIPPVAHRRRVPFQLVAHGPGDGHPLVQLVPHRAGLAVHLRLRAWHAP